MENSTIYKRLGFLVELLEFDSTNSIVRACKSNLKSGYSQLDPSTKGDRLETKWNLWLPKAFNIKDRE